MNETKTRIIQQALKYFAENDYDRASLNSIAKALKITKGGIYHYFESKENLFMEVINYLADSMDMVMAQALPENPDIETVVLAMFSFTDMSTIGKAMGFDDLNIDYFTIVNLIFASMKKFPEVKARFIQSYRSMADMLEGMLSAAREKGEIRQDINVRQTALEIVTLGEGAMLMTSFFEEADCAHMMNLGRTYMDRIKA